VAKSYGQRRSKLQENRIAADVGGRRQSGSGSSDFAKGDVRKQGDLRVEAKTTSSKSYALKASEIAKINGEAAMAGEDWAMQIEFQGQMGRNRKVAVIDWQTFLDLRAENE